MDVIIIINNVVVNKSQKETSPSPLSPSPLFAFDDLAISESNNTNDDESEDSEDLVILENLAAVRRFKLHPSLLSDRPMRVVLFNQDVGIEGMRDVTELLWVCRGPLFLDLGRYELKSQKKREKRKK